MRRTRLWILVVALLLAAGAIAACGGDDDDDGDEGAAAPAEIETIETGTLTVGSDIPFPPFEQGDPPNYEGFDIDLINEVADRLGLETTIRDVPFDAILQGARGRYDLAIAATTITDPRENRVDFSDPYFIAEQSLLVRSDGDVQSVEDLAGATVGAQDGTTGETFANEETDAGEVRPFPEIDDAYTALENGQVDAVLNDLPSTQEAAKESENLEVVEVFDTGEEYGILFSEEQDDALRLAVNEALVEIKGDGTLDELYRKWFDKDAPDELERATHEPN